VATLTEEQARLFLEPNFGWCAVIRPDGTPQLTVVWVDWDGERVVFNTAEGRAKPRHLRRDSRISVAVYDRNDPYRWVTVEGRAELDHEGAVEHIDTLQQKYRGKPKYPLPEGERRVIVRVRPERVTAKL
jgi:PPOX class probable F420-dependent enzyme